MFTRNEENDREPFRENLCNLRCRHHNAGSFPHLNICLTHFLDRSSTPSRKNARHGLQDVGKRMR